MTHRSIPHAWLFGFLLTLLPGLTLPPAHAQPPDVFSALEPAADFATPLQTAPSDTPGPPPLRHRQVAIDLPLLDTLHETADTASAASALTLNLFPDATFSAIVTTVGPTYSGGYALSGHLAGEPLSTFTLVVNDEEVAGSVLTPLDSYEIDSTPDLPGGVVIRQMDATNQADECETQEPDSLPESEHAHPPPDPVVSSGEAVPTSSSSPTIIDIAVFYTPLAKSGRWNIESHIDNAVAATNKAFADSNVNQRLRLVHRGQIAYTESGSLETDATRLRVGNDGHMDGVHGIRNAVGADLVHLLVAKSSGLCGTAYLMKSINSSFAGHAFGAHHYYCNVGSFAHEVGHNLGLRHDRYLDKKNTPQPCAHGYVNRAGLKPSAGQWARWYTLMAYNNHCAASGVSCSRIRRFSNANQTWHGHALGIAGCQRSNGVDGPAHAWETLTNSAGTVAAFRNSTPTFGDETIANYTYPQNNAITALTLPAAKRGDGSLSYSLTEQNQTATLPAGLSFDADSRTLSGTPTALQSAKTYTYTATDTDDDTDALTFTLTIAADTNPSFGTQSIANRTYTKDLAIPSVMLPTGTSGNAPLTYSVSGLPAGLSFDADTRTLSGTPTGTQTAKTATYTVTDLDADTASLTFTLTVESVGLTAAAGNQQVTLSWTSGADSQAGITQWEYQQGNGAWTAIPNSAQQATGSYTVTGLTNGTAYTFTVRAVNAQGNAESAAVTATPVTTPAKPTGLTATAGDQQVALAWTAPTNTGGSAITAYQVSQNNGTTWTGTGSTTTSHTLTSLTNGTAYTFTVRAVNAQGKGAASDAVTATPATTPAKPTGLTATPGNRQMTLAWTAPTNTGGAVITAYQVSRDNGTTWTGTGSTNTSHTVTGLTNGTAYAFMVRAVNAQGAGTASDAVTATPATIPAKPTDFTATAGHHQVTLAWTSGGDGGSAILEWRYSWDDGANWDTTGATATRYSVYLPTNGTPYTFRVRGVNAKGLGPPSDAASATPRGFTATKGDGQATLNWSKLPANTAIERWEYRQKAGSGEYGAWTAIPNSTAGTTSYTVTNLTNGQTYTFQVRGKDSTDAILARVEFPPVTPAQAPVNDTPGGNGGGGSGSGGGGGQSRVPGDRHGDTPATASLPRLGGTMSGYIQSVDDIDYFQVSVPANGILSVATTGTTNTIGTLEQAGTILARDDNSGAGLNFQIAQPVAPGVYHIAVWGLPGPYTLAVRLVQGRLETPAADTTSAQSGLSVLRGWVCDADLVEIELERPNGTTYLLEPAAGTARGDVAATCGGVITTGFGLLWNWNILGEGTYTVRALADEVVFGEATVTVTMPDPSDEYLTGVSGQTLVTNFPAAGQEVRLVWSQSLQNFSLTSPEAVLPPRPASVSVPWGYLENPSGASFQSGLGVISGWVCEAETVILAVTTEAGLTYELETAYGTGRADAAARCGGKEEIGFGLLFNWNLLGAGVHTLRAVADGEEFGRAAVRVTTLGREYLTGVRGRARVVDFPAEGQTVRLEWQQAAQNFVITGVGE